MARAAFLRAFLVLMAMLELGQTETARFADSVVAASYAVREAWTVDCTLERHLNCEAADNLGLHLGLTALF